MKNVRRIFSRRLIASGFALALSSFALLSTPAKAVDGCNGAGTVTYYYNKNGQVVGRYSQACNSTVCEGTGAITSNFDIQYLACPPPGGGA
ncbi:MAG TPA: hypothetical protein VHC97_24550 [Thermoanaerobaculia bacterium]|nr:hypothetical protein [Thermoanaerobaculia bacterium]